MVQFKKPHEKFLSFKAPVSSLGHTKRPIQRVPGVGGGGGGGKREGGGGGGGGGGVAGTARFRSVSVGTLKRDTQFSVKFEGIYCTLKVEEAHYTRR